MPLLWKIFLFLTFANFTLPISQYAQHHYSIRFGDSPQDFLAHLQKITAPENQYLEKMLYGERSVFSDIIHKALITKMEILRQFVYRCQGYYRQGVLIQMTYSDELDKLDEIFAVGFMKFSGNEYLIENVDYEKLENGVFLIDEPRECVTVVSAVRMFESSSTIQRRKEFIEQ